MALDLPIDLAALPGPVQRMLGPGAPPPLRLLAARGAAPGLRPEQIVTVMAMLAWGELPHVEDTARTTAAAAFGKLPPPVVAGALASPELPTAIIDKLAVAYVDDFATLELVVMHPAIAASTVVHLAKVGSEAITELVATNEERLLANPEIIEALYMNRRTRMSTADRVLDLAVRNGKQLSIPSFREAAEAIKDELIMAPDAEPTPDDMLFHETQKVAEAIDAELAEPAALFEEDDEGKEVIKEKALPLEQRIREMTVSQKVRLATLGTGSARALLVRDKNRIVAAAAIRSPMIQEAEVANYAGSRAVSEDVLRIIGSSGDLTKSHTVKFNLVSNPKTPMSIALRMLTHLRQDELKKLSKSKNVSGQIAKLARQELDKKKPGAH